VGVYVAVRGILMKFLFDIALEFRLNLFHLYYTILTCEIFVLLLICWLGVWAANRTEALVGRKDPGVVVIDEVAGQFIALLPVPFVIDQAWWSAVVAFFLFRIFDIIKPYPARRLESLHGGLGIMADDLVAGFYTALSVAVLVSLDWFI
jgi:phosphatidylglycerophosphatase A